MNIGHYNSGQAGDVVGDKVYPIGEALVQAGHLKDGYTMIEVVDVLANQPAAMQCARKLSDGDHLRRGIERIGEMELHVQAER